MVFGTTLNDVIISGPLCNVSSSLLWVWWILKCWQMNAVIKGIPGPGCLPCSKCLTLSSQKRDKFLSCFWKAVGKLPLQACCEGRESTARGGNSLSAARGSCCQQLPLQGHPSPGCPTECNCSGANCKVLGCTTGCTENCGYRKQCFSGLLKLMTLWRDGSTFSTHKKAHFPLDFPRWIDWLLMNCKKKSNSSNNCILLIL